MTDRLKDRILQEVQEAVTEQFDGALDNAIDIEHTVEVQPVTPSELMLRVKSTRRDGAAPRYFRVKVSESL